MDLLVRSKFPQKALCCPALLRLLPQVLTPNRSMSKVNIKHPKPRLMARRVLEAVTKPIYPHDIEDPAKRCTVKMFEKKEALGLLPENKENLYEQFLIREARKVFEANRMILAVQTDSMDMRKKTSIFNRLVSIGLEPIVFPADILTKSVANTRWVNLSVLLCRPTVLLASPQPNVSGFLKVARRMPEITLLGGLVDDRLLTREGLLRYAQLPDLDGLRAELLALLSAPAGRIHALLGAQQSALSASLAQHVRQEGSGGDGEAKDS